MRKVLIGTPSYDGKVEAVYVSSLLAALKECPAGVEIHPVFLCYDALVQRARNDLVQMALESDCTDLIFIDADQGWEPDWIYRLLASSHDVIGGAVVKKSTQVAFNVKALDTLHITSDGLMEVECLGTGFLRLSRAALQAVWDVSETYSNSDKLNRMVFDIKVVDGELISEDNVFCQKWRALGGKVWVDTTMTCSHVGTIRYVGSLQEYLHSSLQVAA